MKKILFLLWVCLLTVACKQNETAANSAPTQNNDTKPAAIRISQPNTDAAETAVAADADGNFYVLYVEHGANKSADVFLQKVDAQMKLVEERVRVNPKAGEATAWRGDAPTIVVSADKTVFVGWTKQVETASGNGTDLYLSVSRDGGKSFAAPVKVNDDIAPASHGMHSLAIGKNNEIFMAWLDERNLKNAARAENSGIFESDFQFVKAHHNTNQAQKPEAQKPEKLNETAEPNSEVFFAASVDGGKTFSANVKLSSDVCPCCKTNLLVAADNRIYASWRQVLSGDFRHIAVASSNDAGKNFSAPMIVSDDSWQIAICPVSGAPMHLDKNNQLKIVWFTAGKAGTPGLYGAESADFGKTFSKRILVSDTIVSGTPVWAADESGDFKIIWEAEGKIYQSKAGTNGKFVQTEIISNGTLPAAATAGRKLGAAFIRRENEKRAVWLIGI